MLQWENIRLEALPGTRFGYLRVVAGKSKNARRNIPVTDRVALMLRKRLVESSGMWVFANRGGKPYLVTSVNHLHEGSCVRQWKIWKLLFHLKNPFSDSQTETSSSSFAVAVLIQVNRRPAEIPCGDQLACLRDCQTARLAADTSPGYKMHFTRTRP